MQKRSYFSGEAGEALQGGVIHAAPFGPIAAISSPQGLLHVFFGSLEEFCAENGAGQVAPAGEQSPAYACLRQVEEYLAGRRRSFDLPFDPRIFTAFQRQALPLVEAIPYGEVRTYGQLAAQLGKPGASRAVGGANARNPLPIVIPCHRVVGSTRHLHGYSAPGRLGWKAWLLAHEGVALEGLRVGRSAQLKLF